MLKKYLLLLMVVCLFSFLNGCAKMTTQEASAYLGKPNTDSNRQTQASATAKNEQDKLELLSTGTGFFITGNGVLVTNYHVVEDGNVASIFYNDKLIPAKILKIDPSNDLAILKVQIPTTPAPVTTVFNGNRGEEVFTLGYPISSLQGIEQKATFGRINAKSGVKDDIRFIQIDVPVHPGNSGGPLFNAKGEVIGVVSSILDYQATIKYSGALPQNVAYALKSDYIWPLLRQAGIEPAKTKGISMSIPSLVSKLEGSVVQIYMFQRH